MAAGENQVTDVKFYTVTGSRIPLTEVVSDLKEYPVLLQVNGDRTFALNFTDEFKVQRDVSNDITEEEHFYDFANGVGLKDYEKFFYSNLSHQVMKSLPNKRDGKEMSAQ